MPREPADPGADRPVRRSVERAAAAVLLLAAAWSLAHLLHFGYGRDQAIYHVVADEMARGGAPYQDAWDFKPPGIFAAFRIAQLFGDGPGAIRVLEALAWASLVYAFALLGRRFVGSWLAGLAGGALACWIHAQLEYWHTAQPESFAAVALAWALVCATAEPRSRARQWAAWTGAGALYGAAFLMKPPLAGGIVVTWLVVVRRVGWRAWRAPTFALAGGASLPIALCLVYFAAHGALDDLYDTLFVFTPKYTAIDFRWTKLPELCVRAFADWLVGYSALIAIGLGCLLALPPAAPRERALVGHVAGVGAFPLFGVALQAKFFPYHFDTALALGALLGAYGLWKAARRLDRRWLPVAIAVAVIAAIGRPATKGVPGTWWRRSALRHQWLGADPAERQRIDDRLYATSDFDPSANREAAHWLRDHSRPGEPVLVFGFEPAIYIEAGRHPASRYLYNVPQRVAWAPAAYRARYLADLAAHPPAAIAIRTDDRFAWVVGNSRSSLETLETFPELRAYLDAGYQLTETRRSFQLYVRRSDSPQQQQPGP